MARLCLPELVTVRLLSWQSEPFRCADILVGVRTFARAKNDFHLGPFATNADGICTFTKQDLHAEAEAHYDTGLMDYRSIEDCYPLVELSLFSPEHISKALKARTEIWTCQLNGENKRWKSIEELISLYRRASAAIQTIDGYIPYIRGEWAEPGANFEYSFYVRKNGEPLFPVKPHPKQPRWRFW